MKNIVDKGVRDLDGAKKYLRDSPMASYERFGFGLWRVGLPENDLPIGMAGLVKRDYLDDIDIGYALLPEYCRAGYAFEAASAIMDYARKSLQASRVLAIVNEDNIASISLLGKLNFRADGMVRIPGVENEVRLFAWTKSEVNI